MHHDCVGRLSLVVVERFDTLMSAGHVHLFTIQSLQAVDIVLSV